MSRKHSILESFLKGRFSLLLISLSLLFFIGPLFPGDQSFADKVLGLMIIAVLGSCLRAVSRSRRFFIFMLLFTLLNVGLGSVEILYDNDPHVFQTGVLVIRISYLGLVFFSVMAYVLDSSPVTVDKICGAISAYLLMGLAWSSIYTLFYHLDPTSFVVSEKLLSPESINSTWTMYFSFTTLTTLGFGDITPQTPLVQSYTIMEAACGQIFLAVIVARLIALHIVHDREES